MPNPYQTRKPQRVRGPRQSSLNGRLFQCACLIERAERKIGPLSAGQRSDLLLDNFEWILDSVEAHELVKLLNLPPAKSESRADGVGGPR